ncbi:MAG TPA: Gfo/Idh/MocA family oxidoreductase [Gemmatimonadales bacterium]|nr:Gfo/Idh/MocA family oxidoreductase [Gemmatimonadales bacterium]
MTLRIGIVGTGFAKRVQLPGLRLVPEVEVTAISSGQRANADAVAREFGIPHVFDDGVDLARSGRADLVLVSSTPASHARYAVAALEAGCHLLCEKPLALDAAEAWQIVAAAERRPRQVAWVDHELRYEPNRRRIRDLVREGAIGDVRHIEIALKPYIRGDGRPQAPNAAWTWWFDAAQGGGILGAVGSHLIDLCRFWTGREVVQVAGRAQTFVRERVDAAGTTRPATADEFASAVLTLAGGVIVTLTLSIVAQHGPGHIAQISGTEGSLVLSGETRLEIGKPGGPLEDISVPDDLSGKTAVNNMWARSFVRLMRDLAATIGGGPTEGEPATIRDGWRIQRVLDAIRTGGCTPLD